MPNKPQEHPTKNTAVLSEDSSSQEPHPQVSKWARLKIGVIIALVVAAIVYIVWDIASQGPLMSLFVEENREQLQQVISSWGIFAPLLYIILQIAQTVVAPIPGQIVGSIGGYLFGAWGILWTTIGTLIGCFIVFKLARRFGRPLLEKFFKKSAIKHFDFVVNSRSASFVLFLIFLLPGFPDDLICYIAGLTKLSTRRLMLIVLLGRLPVITVTNYLGAGLATNLNLVIIVSVVSVVVLGIAVSQRERITKFLKQKSSSDDSDSKSSKSKD